MIPTPSEQLCQELCLFSYQVLRLLPSSTSYENGIGNEKHHLSSTLLSFLEGQVQTNRPSVASLAIHILLLTTSADSNPYLSYCIVSLYLLDSPNLLQKLCNLTCHLSYSDLKPLLLLLGHLIIQNTIQDSFILVLFWTSIHHFSNPAICSLIDWTLRSIACDGLKGNPTDSLLDVSIEWFNFCKLSVKEEEYEQESLLNPLTTLINWLRSVAAFNEKVFVDGIVCYFVKVSELLALILLEQERQWISKRGKSMLEVGYFWRFDSWWNSNIVKMDVYFMSEWKSW